MSKNPLSLRDLPQRGRTNPVNITGFQPPFQGGWGVDPRRQGLPGFQPPFQGGWGVDPRRQGLSGEVFEMKELKL